MNNDLENWNRKRQHFEDLNHFALYKDRFGMPKSIQKSILAFIILGTIATIFGIVGHMDKNDELADRAHYCNMVAKGSWPDFRHIAKTECNVAGGRAESPR